MHIRKLLVLLIILSLVLSATAGFAADYQAWRFAYWADYESWRFAYWQDSYWENYDSDVNYETSRFAYWADYDYWSDYQAWRFAYWQEGQQKPDFSQFDFITWGASRIKAIEAQMEFGLTGKGVKVAVIDTGITPYKDLKVSGGVSFVDYTDSYLDDNGHGTFVAGVIASRRNNYGLLGIAPGVELYAIKVLDQNGQGNEEDLVKAIEWAIANDIDIINISFGSTEDSQEVRKAIKKAWQSGIVIVGAAGNLGGDGKQSVTTPASYAEVISVGAIDHDNVRLDFSSYGAKLDFMAPGVDVVGWAIVDQFVVGNGTSAAAPHVTGAIALLKEYAPDLTPNQVVHALKKNAVDLGQKSEYGYGLIDIYQTIKNLK